MKRWIPVLMMLLVCFAWIGRVAADELDQGRQLMQQGQLGAAAEFFNRFVQGKPNDQKLTPEALAMSGRVLDAMADYLTGEAEKRCYWAKGGGQTPECMQREAEALNGKYGSGSFQYEHQILFIFYTGAQYRQILSRFSRSAYVPEAEFYLLLRELAGHPDIVLPRIKAYMAKHPKGDWHRRGLLLWARVNEDVWFVHRKWSWVLFNNIVAPEELMIRAEPYRQEAMRAYQELMKDKNTYEGQAAAREYAMLSQNQDNGSLISIVNDSAPGTLSSWGVPAPAPMAAQTREVSRGSSSYQPPLAPAPAAAPAARPSPASPAPVPQAAPAPSAPPSDLQPESSAPKRWN